MPNETDRTERQQKIFQALKHSFLRAFRGMDRELRMHTNIDCLCSGTTAVTLVKQGEFLVIGNVGDSRAILGRRDKDNSLTAVQLTVDLKPDNPGEADRIMKCKGRVFALQDEPGIARLWLPNSDSPGLAMARAFGDFCLKDFGLISVPEISCQYLTESDEFIVLATDGIWDVLSNEEVVDIVASSPARSSAARTLVESAVHAWKCKYPTAKVDDCIVLCLFLDSGVACADSTVESRECSAAADQVNAGYGEDHYLPIDHLDISKHEETHLGSEEDQYAVEEVSYIGTLVNHPGLSHRRATRMHPRKHDEADSYH
ncbi:hypothetical protein SAY87_012041 [Trapa incisa]|uniref:PPM-type phosphatase domain-containing protein n=1 Tax=Trapa incisa TaxID=236973 RepID=A0AAN7GPQ6_9MYRT|nr:hypothetical protein SAY87_012041 [Trapa incisa]